jgi:NTP pyrophosphatase (non-canonical NTP hydrolase)
MTFEDLLKFIKDEDKRIKEKYGNYSDNEKRILVRAVKLSEEVGELCSEVLKYNSFQRKEKMEKDSDLEGELADVIITTLLLTESLGVDIEKALRDKIEKIEKRYN